MIALLAAGLPDDDLRKKIRRESRVEVYPKVGAPERKSMEKQVVRQKLCSDIDPDYFRTAVRTCDLLFVGRRFCWSRRGKQVLQDYDNLFSFAAVTRQSRGLFVKLICTQQNLLWNASRKCLGPAGFQLLDSIKKRALEEGLEYVALESVNTQQATTAYYRAGFRFVGDCRLAEDPEVRARVESYDGKWLDEKLGKPDGEGVVRPMMWCAPAKEPPLQAPPSSLFKEPEREPVA